MVRLTLDGISVSYPARGKVLDGVSFSVNDGGILCILGPTGCGKTTTLRVISGMVAPQAGTVTIDGEPLRGGNHTRIGYIFQEPRLLPWRSVLGNVEFALEPHDEDESSRRTSAMELLRMVGLEGMEMESPGNLSGGERQRVSLARALAPDPTLLLADEPFSSLDVATRQRMLALFTSVVERAGKTTVFVTHDIFEALHLADHLIVYSKAPVRVRAAIEIADPRPRDPQSPRMMSIRSKIMELLRE